MPKYEASCLLSGSDTEEKVVIKAKDRQKAERWLRRNFYVKKIIKIELISEKQSSFCPTA